MPVNTAPEGSVSSTGAVATTCGQMLGMVSSDRVLRVFVS